PQVALGVDRRGELTDPAGFQRLLADGRVEGLAVRGEREAAHVLEELGAFRLRLLAEEAADGRFGLGAGVGGGLGADPEEVRGGRRGGDQQGRRTQQPAEAGGTLRHRRYSFDHGMPERLVALRFGGDPGRFTRVLPGRLGSPRAYSSRGRLR